jgi:uncharacterized membrane protein
VDHLIIYLALNGVLVLTVSLIAGLFLYLAIRDDREQAAWHLLHAGGTGRGVMLLALAAIIEYPVLSSWQLASVVWLVIIFTWTSMFAMGIRAVSGERGLRLDGTIANKLVYILYALGTIAIFPACILLIHGFIKAI